MSEPMAPHSQPPGLARKAQAKRIIAVGGGKGGVGKSMVSSSLAIAIARRGFRVTLVDADLGGANLHTCLGIPQPASTLSDFIVRRTERLEEVMVPTGIPNLNLIAGARDAMDVANPRYQQKLKLLRHLQALQVDYVILDLGAGSSYNTLDFFLIADHGIVVVLPEPTSIENAYRFVKAAFFRRLQNASEQYNLRHLLDTVMASQEGALRTPYEFVAQVKLQNAVLGAYLDRELKSFNVKVVVNQVRQPADEGVGNAVVSAWKKFFGLQMDFLGPVRHDEDAWQAVRNRRPLLVDFPNSIASAGLTKIAENLISLDARAGLSK